MTTGRKLSFSELGEPLCPVLFPQVPAVLTTVSEAPLFLALAGRPVSVCFFSFSGSRHDNNTISRLLLCCLQEFFSLSLYPIPFELFFSTPGGRTDIWIGAPLLL